MDRAAQLKLAGAPVEGDGDQKTSVHEVVRMACLICWPSPRCVDADA